MSLNVIFVYLSFLWRDFDNNQCRKFFLVLKYIILAIYITDWISKKKKKCFYFKRWSTKIQKNNIFEYFVLFVTKREIFCIFNRVQKKWVVINLFFLCMFCDNFLPRGPISLIVFLLERRYPRGGPILIWSSSDHVINDKIIKIFNSFRQ